MAEAVETAHWPSRNRRQDNLCVLCGASAGGTGNLVPGKHLPNAGISHHGTLGGRQVDGLNPNGQRPLQVLKHILARPFAILVIQELLECLIFNEDHHIFKEIAFTVCRELCDPEELWGEERKQLVTGTVMRSLTQLQQPEGHRPRPPIPRLRPCASRRRWGLVYLLPCASPAIFSEA